MIDRYVREVLPGFPVKGVRPTGDKATRAAPFSSMVQAGNVLIVRGRWVGAYLDELEAFPLSGAHDDAVDAVVGAFSVLAERKQPRIRRLR